MSRLVLGAILVIGSACYVSADDASPFGEPKGMAAGQSARYYVWCDDDAKTWHIRTTTAGKMGVRNFQGTVTAKGGPITSANTEKLEVKGKVKDFWEIKDSGKTLTFELNTRRGLDGFDFVLGKGVTDIEFDFKIDGEAKGEKIFVGKQAKTYNSSHFALKLKAP
jgi:hypothetical protein